MGHVPQCCTAVDANEFDEMLCTDERRRVWCRCAGSE